MHAIAFQLTFFERKSPKRAFICVLSDFGISESPAKVQLFFLTICFLRQKMRHFSVFCVLLPPEKVGISFADCNNCCTFATKKPGTAPF